VRGGRGKEERERFERVDCWAYVLCLAMGMGTGRRCACSCGILKAAGLQALCSNRFGVRRTGENTATYALCCEVALVPIRSETDDEVLVLPHTNHLGTIVLQSFLHVAFPPFIHLQLWPSMASLNTSTNGPSIKSSYQGVVNSTAPSGPAASSPTYGQWAVFSVSAPLVNAFQQDSRGKESVLKVQSTGGTAILLQTPLLS
jgi:hypothetical protein